MTDLDLDGLDLGPLMNYMKEILYDRVEKHIDRGPRQIPIAVGAATAIFLPRVIFILYIYYKNYTAFWY